MALNKRKKELLAYLGTEYTRRVIDLEDCLYRDFGDYDVEISGGGRGCKFHVFVWRTRPHMEIVERYMDLPLDYAAMKRLLDDITQRYTHRADAPNIQDADSQSCPS